MVNPNDSSRFRVLTAQKLELLGALHGADALHAAKAENHAIQMTQVFGFDDELDHCLTIVIVMDIDAADVGVVVGDDGGEFFQHAGTVVAVDGDFDGITLPLSGDVIAHARPLHIDAAVGFIEQVLHVWAAAGVDGDTLPPGHVADNFFSPNGIAAPRAIDEQIVLAFDLK